jgi:hypothetical protein
MYAGQALSAASGYQGQMDKITVSVNNAKEIIGKDLLNSLTLIQGKDGFAGATSSIEGFATAIGDAIYGVTILIEKLKGLPGGGFLSDLLKAFAGFSGFNFLRGLGAKSKYTYTGGPAQQSPGDRKKIDKANADALKLTKTKNQLSAIDNANTTRKLALTGDELALAELTMKFDVERIGLYTALNSATDGETKMRLLSLIAINEQNGALASQIKAADGATTALEQFRQVILASVRALLDEIALKQALLMKNLGIKSPSSSPFSPSTDTGFVLNDPYNFGQFQQGERDTMRQYMASQGATNITINATGIGDQQIATVVQNAIQNLNRYGNSTTFAGAI